MTVFLFVCFVFLLIRQLSALRSSWLGWCLTQLWFFPGLKAPECASGMYKETVWSAFHLLMHYPPASRAGQHLQSQPPLVSDPSSQTWSQTGYFLAYADEAWIKKGLLPRLRIPRCPFPVHTQWSLTQKENSGVPGLQAPHLPLAFALPACPCRCLCWTVLGLGDRDLLKTVWS